MTVIPTAGGSGTGKLGTVTIATRKWGAITITGLPAGQYQVLGSVIYAKMGQPSMQVYAPASIVNVP